MPTLLDAKRRAAAAFVLGLGVALLIALAPYATGLVWIPVLYVALAPVYACLARRAGARGAASLLVAIPLLLLIVLGGSFTGLIVREAQRIAGTGAQSPILTRLSELSPGAVNVGA
jgi:predicted PurR-regulated permease PerM